MLGGLLMSWPSSRKSLKNFKNTAFSLQRTNWPQPSDTVFSQFLILFSQLPDMHNFTLRTAVGENA
jgi:hypothetical protein